MKMLINIFVKMFQLFSFFFPKSGGRWCLGTQRPPGDLPTRKKAGVAISAELTWGTDHRLGAAAMAGGGPGR
jgi:hypothetical protein